MRANKTLTPLIWQCGGTEISKYLTPSTNCKVSKYQLFTSGPHRKMRVDVTRELKLKPQSHYQHETNHFTVAAVSNAAARRLVESSVSLEFAMLRSTSLPILQVPFCDIRAIPPTKVNIMTSLELFALVETETPGFPSFVNPKVQSRD